MGIETFRSDRDRRRWQPSPRKIEDSLERSWSAISKTRMVFGLGAAPILPSAVFWSWVGVRANNPVMGDLIFEIAISTGFTICWFIGIGSLFLAWMGRTYGAIARFTCFALCGTLTFSMPLAGAMIDFATAPPAGAVDGFLLVLASAIAGLVLAPLGVFGGWLVWRIAVRPAAIPLEEVAEVF